jgi:glycosyltransferase involved in cell wall biosynthesis
MGRIVIEAFCRARPVIGSRAGGIPDLISDGANGFLVDSSDTRALADALVAVLDDAALARTLGAAAHASAGPWLQTPEEFAIRTRALVEAPTRVGTEGAIVGHQVP